MTNQGTNKKEYELSGLMVMQCTTTCRGIIFVNVIQCSYMTRYITIAIHNICRSNYDELVFLTCNLQTITCKYNTIIQNFTAAIIGSRKITTLKFINI